ncbi:MAG TPA: glycerophosphodiester phosphodiesterase [Opitutaceae bacterium]|nr:glycerophosphodiester phosphodiesterase [Opitutaceae bacterium]
MEIIAHRGASHDAPENTLAAARLAWEQGADALECDVHLTRDGRLAVIHDEGTRRVAARSIEVAAASLADLQKLDVGSWKAPRFAGEKIPSLDQLLALVPAGKRVFIELKTGPAAVDELVRCLVHCTLKPAQVAVISFNLEAVRAAKKALPRCEACWLLEREPGRARPPVEEIIATCCAAELDGLDLEAEWPVDAAFAMRVRDAGLSLYAWTVDEAATAQALMAAGVDGITTNRPGWLREQIQIS